MPAFYSLVFGNRTTRSLTTFAVRISEGRLHSAGLTTELGRRRRSELKNLN